MTVATLPCMILETITKQNYHISDFSKMWSAFSGLSIYRDITNFIQILNLLKKNQNCRNLSEILNTTGKIENIKRADHNLEKLAIDNFVW